MPRGPHDTGKVTDDTWEIRHVCPCRGCPAGRGACTAGAPQRAPHRLFRRLSRRAACRFIIGTHDGLAGNSEIGKRFQERLYSRYIEWDGQLLSAPVAVRLPDSEHPAFCFLAPRPEQLARLAVNLVSAITARAQIDAIPEAPQRPSTEVTFTVNVPPGNTALRFRPIMRTDGRLPIPGDVDRYRYRVEVENDGRREVIWHEDIPPFHALGNRTWWDDRLVSTADLGGRNRTFR